MGEPEHIGSDETDEIEPPASLVERLKAHANGQLTETEEAVATVLAHRFKPDAPEPPEPREPLTSPEPAKPAPLVSRALLTTLVGVALAPTITVGALLWHGLIVTPWIKSAATQTGTAPTAQLANMAGLVGTQTVQPKQDVILPVIALTAPEAFAVDAGGEIPFTIALDATGPVPPRSIIAVRGLPAGSAFSAGRPYGETEWTLRPDEIGDLNLRVPGIAGGRRELTIELLTADGTVLARTAARLEVGGARAELITRPNETSRIGDLIAHGEKMVEVGYFPGARAYFKRAAEAGSAAAALAMGETFDPAFIARIGAQGIRAEPEQARAWYERAGALGADQAEAKLAALARAEIAPPVLPTPVTPPADPATDKQATGDQAAKGQEPSNQGPRPAQRLVATGGAKEPAGPEWVEVSRPANMREGPSSEAETIKVEQKGTRLHEIGRDGNWVQVANPKTKEAGWIYSRYVEKAE